MMIIYKAHTPSILRTTLPRFPATERDLSSSESRKVAGRPRTRSRGV